MFCNKKNMKELTMHTLLLLLLGFILTVQAAFLRESRPNTNLENRIEETDDTTKPITSTIKVKDDLNAKQQNLFLNSKPNMIEKIKILNQVRKFKDLAEEKTNVILRTRIISLVDSKPKLSKSHGSDFNYIDTDDDMSECPIDSDDDYSAVIMTNTNVNSNEKLIQTVTTKNKQKLHHGLQNEMPIAQHLPKKELQSNLININSIEDISHPREDTINNLDTIDEIDTNAKSIPTLINYQY